MFVVVHIKAYGFPEEGYNHHQSTEANDLIKNCLVWTGKFVDGLVDRPQ